MAAQKPSWQRSALSQLKHWNPDVVGLSEFRESATSQAIAESLAGIGLTYQQTTVGASDRRRNFLLLASRFPLQIEPSAGLLNSSGRWLHAVVRDVNLMLMHVPNRSDAKWQFHDDVITQLSRFESGRAIAMGDTNTGSRGLMKKVNSSIGKRARGWKRSNQSAGRMYGESKTRKVETLRGTAIKKTDSGSIRFSQRPTLRNQFRKSVMTGASTVAKGSFRITPRLFLK